MNEKLQYATMLEIPVNTCNVTFKPLGRKKVRRKKAVNNEVVKAELMEKVNSELSKTPIEENQIETSLDTAVQEETLENLPQQKKRPFKFSVVGVQLAIIGVLVATIFLTNAFYPDSGINVFMRSVFGGDTVAVSDTRVYGDFAPVISLDDNVVTTLSDGVVTFSGEGSVYASCDGKVTALVKGEDGKYTIEITHSDNFKSVLKGLDFAYAELGDMVYGNIPVGYAMEDGVSMCFVNGEDVVISNYEIIDNMVVWAV